MATTPGAAADPPKLPLTKASMARFLHATHEMKEKLALTESASFTCFLGPRGPDACFTLAPAARHELITRVAAG